MDADPEPFEPLPVLGSEQIYDSPWCGLRRDLLRLPDGATQEYHVVEISDAVVVVPELPDGRLLLVWQFRHPHGRTHWEVPAGRLHQGESPEDGALRELREETGHEAGRLEPLPGFFPINGISDHYAHAFVAHDCKRVGDVQLDDSEDLEVHEIDVERVRERLLDGTIQDGFSMLALYAWLARREG